MCQINLELINKTLRIYKWLIVLLLERANKCKEVCKFIKENELQENFQHSKTLFLFSLS